ncbi:MAG: MraY family glycosyltransferase, partial [Candidatus Hinthialibacter sp.]
MGATIGFLPFNFSPAKIFMGDAGSLYLGVLLAGSSLVSNTKGATVMSLSLPLVILTIPLLDALLTVVRRGKRGMNLFAADREHVHHRLLRLGFNVRQSVLSLYGLCFLLAMAAVLADQLPEQFKMLFLFVFFAAVWWGFLVFSAIERRVIGKTNSGHSILNAGSARQSSPEQR